MSEKNHVFKPIRIIPSLFSWNRLSWNPTRLNGTLSQQFSSSIHQRTIQQRHISSLPASFTSKESVAINLKTPWFWGSRVLQWNANRLCFLLPVFTCRCWSWCVSHLHYRSVSHHQRHLHVSIPPSSSHLLSPSSCKSVLCCWYCECASSIPAIHTQCLCSYASVW